MSHDYDTSDIPAVSTEEEERYRREFPHAVRSQAYGGNALHLPGEDKGKPLCNGNSRKGWRIVGWKCFPMGHERICKLCAEKERVD